MSAANTNVCRSRFPTRVLQPGPVASIMRGTHLPNLVYTIAMKRSSPVTPSESETTPATGTADVAVVLPPRCTINEIAALQDCLRGASVAVTLDGSAVQRIDTAGVKLLIAFIRERRAAHGQIQWRGASAVLIHAVIALGVANALHLPAAS
jgi:phospholipid transport system transporter-binding protein